MPLGFGETENELAVSFTVDGAPVWDKWECSECGHEHNGEEDTLTAFCPDCGARMDVKEG